MALMGHRSSKAGIEMNHHKWWIEWERSWRSPLHHTVRFCSRKRILIFDIRRERKRWEE
jgi:uncharacterized protein HemX